MDAYNKDSGRAHSPADDDEEDDGEVHEQIRLVETPDPVIFSRMENGNGRQTPVNAYSRGVQDRTHFNDTQDSTVIQCQNEYYSRSITSGGIKESSKSNSKQFWKGKCKRSPVQVLLSIIPILSWLPKYNLKTDLMYDVVAGFTVAVMHIPQGMAYALLSNVQPIIGLYMAFYPVIMYSILGTSRHISIGTFAVVCLMSGKVATEKAVQYALLSNASLSSDNLSSNESGLTMHPSYTTEQIVTAISLSVGIWQILMGILQLGSLSVLLSAELISGFTTGSAVHVLTSQVKNLLGLPGDKRNGIFRIPLTYMDIAYSLKESNITAVLLSLVTISFLVVYNEILKPLLQKKLPFPIPVELLTIIAGTLISRYWITASTYGISVVNYIPTGLPDATLPPLEIMPDIVADSFIIAIVAYVISISMAKIFSTKHLYEVRPNQELFAIGSSNVFGSFFGCAPSSTSLSRSLIQEQVGGKTQLAGLFSCSILLFVLLWIGPFFETLPHCILSSLIVVALKGMFMQILDLPKMWKDSRINGLIWLVTFFATVLLDISYGLVLGLIVAVLSLLWKSNSVEVLEMGRHVQSNLIVERRPSESSLVMGIPGVKILKLLGNLNFATSDSLTSKVSSVLNRTPFYLTRRSNGKKSSVPNHFPSISVLIIDFSSISLVDPAAIKAIRAMHDTQKQQGVQLLYAACPSNVLQVMDHCKFVNHVNVQYFYPSVEHAISHAESTINNHNDNHEHHHNHGSVTIPGNNFNGYCLRQ